MAILTSLAAGSIGSYLISFIAAEPIAECYIDKKWTLCPEMQACNLFHTNRGRLRFLYHSWVEKYQITCDKKDQRASIKSLMILATSASSLIILPLADIFGRKKILFITNLAIISSMLLIYLSESFSFKIILSGFVAGCCINLSSFYNFLMNESCCNIYIC